MRTSCHCVAAPTSSHYHRAQTEGQTTVDDRGSFPRAPPNSHPHAPQSDLGVEPGWMDAAYEMENCTCVGHRELFVRLVRCEVLFVYYYNSGTSRIICALFGPL